MNKTMLKKYAKAIIRIGANVQKGQHVIINSDINDIELVRYVVEEAYKAKASKVSIEWSDSSITKSNYKYQSIETLSNLPNWVIEKNKYQVETLPCQIYIKSSDPDSLKGIDQGKVSTVRKNTYPILKEFRDAMDNKYQWTIVAAPSVNWAKKVFPNLSKKAAVKALWENILKAARIDENNPIENWKKHNKYLKEKCDMLNNFNLHHLHFKSSNGTDLTLEIMPNTLFLGGGEYTLNGNYFNPNMPTEECFGMPNKYGVNGIVFASKPLSYNGELIEDFSIRFEKGKAVEVHAKKGEELLKEMISMDEGAAYLGEVALVPYNSPISLSNVLFYNTLFDENASCHLALGRAFTNNIKDYESMTAEQINNFEMNRSMIHVDFMIGTKDMEITGVDNNGNTIEIFKNGNWAF